MAVLHENDDRWALDIHQKDRGRALPGLPEISLQKDGRQMLLAAAKAVEKRE